MQIVVKGVGHKSLVPTSVKLEVKFIVNSNNYDNTLEKGSNAIKEFIKLMEHYSIESEDFISDGFIVKERSAFNTTLNKNVFAGYTYYNDGYVLLKYDGEILTDLITELSRLKYCPLIRLSYDVDDSELYELAYQDAVIKANRISKSANLTLKDCLKIELCSNLNSSEEEFINPRVYLNNSEKSKKVDTDLVLDCTFVA